MFRRLLYLHEGDLSRIWPFFLLYLFLFAAFALADGLAQALFVQVVGPDRLPLAYGLVAISNLIVMSLYVMLAERAGAIATFVLILGGSMALFGAVWAVLSTATGNAWWYGVLYAGREIGITLMLMHFGTYLNDFFTRLELSRVLPIIYSGGRVGGILGGMLLQYLAEPLGLINLLGVFVLLCGLGLALSVGAARVLPHTSHPEDHHNDPGLAPTRSGANLEQWAQTSTRGFLRFVWASPLLFWITITSVLFIVSRWILNFRYNTFFGDYFENPAEMAEFLGLYTQIALVASLLVQVLIVNRLVAWVGLRGAHLLYTVLLVVSLFLCLGEMTIGLAIFARLMETELRFGLRNPIMQLITNKFAKGLRVRVRAWSFGMVIPLSTLLSSVLLGLLVDLDRASWIPWLGAACALLYLAASIALTASFSEKCATQTNVAEPGPADGA